MQIHANFMLFMFSPGIFTHFLCANFSETKGVHARANFDAFCISPPLMLISLRSQEAASENNFDDDEDDSVYWIFAIKIKISKKMTGSPGQTRPLM